MRALAPTPTAVPPRAGGSTPHLSLRLLHHVILHLPHSALQALREGQAMEAGRPNSLRAREPKDSLPPWPTKLWQQTLQL